jgi:hypothetical protein
MLDSPGGKGEREDYQGQQPPLEEPVNVPEDDIPF